MSQTNISIRMDSDLKKDFGAFCAEVGMSMTTAFNIFAKKVVRQQRIPFELDTDYVNEETRKAMEEVRRLKADPNKKTYSSFAEILAELENE